MTVPAAVPVLPSDLGTSRLLEIEEASENSNSDSAENPGTWHREREKGESRES